MMEYTGQIFGLSYQDITSMFERHFGTGIDLIEYFLSDDAVAIPGICGEYILPRLSFRLEDGRREAVEVFARRQLDAKESKQSHHYRRLGDMGIPMPRMYGSKLDGDGREILLLERADELPGEDAFFSEQRNVEAFIDLAARVSCAVPSMEYVALIGQDMSGKSDTRDWKLWLPWSVHILDRIWELSAAGNLTDSLRELCRSASLKLSLQERAWSLIDRVNGFETGIAHSDFRPANMVRLRGDGRLGLIDFEDVIVDAKRYDIARYLGAPEAMFKWDYARRDEYLGLYIDRVCAHGGKPLGLMALRRELFALWFARTVNLWEWLPNEYGGPPYSFIPAGRTKEERCANIDTRLKALAGSMPDLRI